METRHLIPSTAIGLATFALLTFGFPTITQADHHGGGGGGGRGMRGEGGGWQGNRGDWGGRGGDWNRGGDWGGDWGGNGYYINNRPYYYEGDYDYYPSDYYYDNSYDPGDYLPFDGGGMSIRFR